MLGVVTRIRGGRPFHAALNISTVVVSLIVSDCGGDECTQGEVRCNNNAAEVCSRGEDDPYWQWGSQPCGDGYCHLSNDTAQPNPFCTVSREPDPQCINAADLGVCDGNDAILCHQGYAMYVADCTNGTTIGSNPIAGTPNVGYCAAVGNWAQCVLESAPNPLCLQAAGRNLVCSGGRKLSCSYGYVIGIESC